MHVKRYRFSLLTYLHGEISNIGRRVLVHRGCYAYT